MDTITAAIGAPFTGTLLPAALVGACPSGVRPAYGAPFQATGRFVPGLVTADLAIADLAIAGLAVAGLGAAVRRRDLTGAGGTKPLGDEPTTAPSNPVQPMTGSAVLGAPAHRTTPGDLPPEDPLS